MLWIICSFAVRSGTASTIFIYLLTLPFNLVILTGTNMYTWVMTEEQCYRLLWHIILFFSVSKIKNLIICKTTRKSSCDYAPRSRLTESSEKQAEFGIMGATFRGEVSPRLLRFRDIPHAESEPNDIVCGRLKVLLILQIVSLEMRKYKGEEGKVRNARSTFYNMTCFAEHTRNNRFLSGW